MEITIDRQSIEDLLEDAGYDIGPCEDTSVQSYSGRGMFGAHCLGIVCDSHAQLMFKLGLALGQAMQRDESAELESLADAMAYGARTDNMGYQTVVYWPNIKLDDDDLTDEDM